MSMKATLKRLLCLCTIVFVLFVTGCSSQTVTATIALPIYGVINCFPTGDNTVDLCLITNDPDFPDEIYAASFDSDQVTPNDVQVTPALTSGAYTLWKVQCSLDVAEEPASINQLVLVGSSHNEECSNFGTLDLTLMEKSIYDIPEFLSVRSITPSSVGANEGNYPETFLLQVNTTAPVQLNQVTVPGYEGATVYVSQQPASDSDNEPPSFSFGEDSIFEGPVALEADTELSIYVDFSTCDCPEALVYYASPVLELESNGETFSVGTYCYSSGLNLTEKELKTIAKQLYQS